MTIERAYAVYREWQRTDGGTALEHEEPEGLSESPEEPRACSLFPPYTLRRRGPCKLDRWAIRSSTCSRLATRYHTPSLTTRAPRARR